MQKPNKKNNNKQQRRILTPIRHGASSAIEDSRITSGSMDCEATIKQRTTVREKFFEEMSKGHPIETKFNEADVNDFSMLATEIECALYGAFQNDSKAYMNQARSVLFNVKDPRNTNFKSKLIAGIFTPAEVPWLTSEQMASEIKQAERAKLRKDSMEEVQSDWDLKHGAANISGLFTCGRCKGNKTTYVQKQTRSSDEPMTTFVTCLKCGKRWKC